MDLVSRKRRFSQSQQPRANKRRRTGRSSFLTTTHKYEHHGQGINAISTSSAKHTSAKHSSDTAISSSAKHTTAPTVASRTSTAAAGNDESTIPSTLAKHRKTIERRNKRKKKSVDKKIPRNSLVYCAVCYNECKMIKLKISNLLNHYGPVVRCTRPSCKKKPHPIVTSWKKQVAKSWSTCKTLRDYKPKRRGKQDPSIVLSGHVLEQIIEDEHFIPPTIAGYHIAIEGHEAPLDADVDGATNDAAGEIAIDGGVEVSSTISVVSHCHQAETD
jgi:hypothetical protein